MTWDGSDRRQNENNNLLVEIHSDLRHLVKSYDKHIEEDKQNFSSIGNKVEFQQKITYGGLGIILFVEFITKFIK